jgi:hypothetical protein
MATGHQAELDPSKWVAIMGIDPMDPTGAADDGVDNLLGIII